MGGLMLVMPLSLIAGLAAASTRSRVGAGVAARPKQVRDERERALQRRRAEAKAALRRHVDEVQFQVGKDSRDMLRTHAAHRARPLHSARRGAVSTSMDGVGRGGAEGRAQHREAERQARGSATSRPSWSASSASPPEPGATARGSRMSAAPRDDVRTGCSSGVDDSTGTARGRRCAGCSTTSTASTSRFGWPSPGKVKAGKSTLLNALVGEEIAPTDAGECTRVVTWYGDGHAPPVTLHPRDGGPPGRCASTGSTARCTSTSTASPAERGRPADGDLALAGLRTTTLIDTPGIASLSVDTSGRADRVPHPGRRADGGGRGRST